MKRKPGRPPIDPDDASVNVYFKLPSKQYAKLWKRAARARNTIPEHLRRLVSRDLGQ